MTIKTRVMSEDDLELADDFIARNFYLDEPIVMANSIPFTPKGLNKLFLPHGVSIVASDDETGTIVGMAINDTVGEERRCYTLSGDDKKDDGGGERAGESRGGIGKTDGPRDFKRRVPDRTRVMFRIDRATEDDVRGAHDLFVRNLYGDEPLIAANGPHALPRWSDGLASAVIRQGRSIVARDASGDVIGCALVDEPPQEFPYIYTHDEADVKFQHMFEHMEKMADIYNVAPDAIEIRYLAVDKSWRGRGVAQAIVEASVEVARQGGYRWLKIYTTSYFSNLLMIKMKWKRLYSLSYKEYVTEFNSDLRIPPEPHTRCNLYIYDLMSKETN